MIKPAQNFSVKLNRLYEEKRKPNGKKFAQTEVIEGTKGYLTRVYLWKLRKRNASNPGLRVIKALTSFSEVDLSFF